MPRSLKRALVAVLALAAAALIHATPAAAGSEDCTTCVLGCPATETEAQMLCAWQCEGWMGQSSCGGQCGGVGSGWMVLSCQTSTPD